MITGNSYQWLLLEYFMSLIRTGRFNKDGVTLRTGNIIITSLPVIMLTHSQDLWDSWDLCMKAPEGHFHVKFRKFHMKLSLYCIEALDGQLHVKFRVKFHLKMALQSFCTSEMSDASETPETSQTSETSCGILDHWDKSSSLEKPLLIFYQNKCYFSIFCCRLQPPDGMQAIAMMEFLKRYNMTYVSILYIDDSYGVNGLKFLSLEARKRDICIALQERIFFDYT